MCRRTALLALALLLAPLTSAQSGPVCPAPDPAFSTVPPCLRTVGHDGIAADPAGAFTVTVMCDPVTVVPFVTVALLFDACTDISICSAQLDPTKAVACGIKMIFGVTDAFGMVTFSVIGGGTPIDFSSPTCMTVLAGDPPVVLGTVAVSAFDLTGAGGVGAADLSLWFTDFGSGLPLPRSDYDCSGAVGANDLALWFATFGGAGSVASCAGIGVSCP